MVEFIQSFYRENGLRTNNRKKIHRDLLLYFANCVARQLEKPLRQKLQKTGGKPIFFIVGVPRSGTTLLYQLLCRFTNLTYVDGRMAKLWLAPLLAAIIYHDIPHKTKINFESTLGVGMDKYAPHEFGYFWQHWMGSSSSGESDEYTEEELNRVDWGEIRRALYSIVDWRDRPLLIKAPRFTNFHIEKIKQELPQAKFIWVKREPLYVAQSLLQARIERYGSEKVWWSIRPKQMNRWTELCPEEQVCCQISEVSKAIEGSFNRLNNVDTATVSYEEIVEDVGRVIRKLANIFSAIEMTEKPDQHRFESQNSLRIGEAQNDIIQQKLKKIFDGKNEKASR